MNPVYSKIRSFLFIVICLSVSARAGAQRFYYVETSNLVDELIKKGLEKSDQYVVGSMMASEYTVRTKVAGSDNSRELNLEIVLADSVTRKEIFRSYEQFCFTGSNNESVRDYNVAIGSFLRRRIGEMIITAKKDHAGLFNEMLKARKDKT